MTRWVLALFLFACGCSTNPSASDAGLDGSSDATIDLCDLDRFIDSGGHGNACPYENKNLLCFHAMTDCPKNGCKCLGMPPKWICVTDIACKDSGPEDAGTDSPSDATTD